MKVDHKNKMFQIMIKILVCMYILIFYSNNVFSMTNKNILNKQIVNDHPKLISAMLPILLPIGLMSLGALVKFIPFKNLFLEFK